LTINRRRFIGLGVGSLLSLRHGTLPGFQGLPQWIESGSPQSDPSLERRREYLAILRRVLPETVPEDPEREGPISAASSSWEDWISETGELPPDFSELPSYPLLPDPLVMRTPDGDERITSLEAWERQKAWIRGEFERWVVGRFPPPPENLRGTIRGEYPSGTATRRDIVLRFGPGMKGSLRLEMYKPEGDGPFPVFLTSHGRERHWVNLAVRRGYLACIFKAADAHRHGGRDDSDRWIELYPDHDFAQLARWAWAGMRAIDYLLTLPEVDPERIGLAGNSRYGKSSLIAAAFDERISAVVPSRGNCGCAIPWRHTTGMFVNEGLEELTRFHRQWFHPRLRFFVGREDRLPIDQNMLLSLVAPRGLLISHAYTEHQGNPWAIEQSYRSVKSVYRFLRAEEKLGLLQRPGEHTITADVLELYLDFFDGVFGRKSYSAPEIIINGYTFDEWERRNSRRAPSDPPLQSHDWASDLDRGVPWETVRTRTRRKIEWVLGEKPPTVAPLEMADSLFGERFRDSSTEERRRGIVYPRTLFDRPLWAEGMGAARLRYGDGLRAEVYYASRGKEGAPRKEGLPTVIWLHPYAYAIGYSRHTTRAFQILTRLGFAVVGVDLIGHGTRVEQIKEFYRRYPRHSLLGRMVMDMEAVITALGDLALVDSERVFAIGSGLGAKVALFLAALDRRVQGVASVCGFSSLRGGDFGGETEGLAHYSHLHGILPRLGRFVDRPAEVPIDYDDVLSLIAPRPSLILAPTLDRYHPVESVRVLVDRARKAFDVFGKASALELETPEGFNGFEFDWPREQRVIDWLEGQVSS
jgi:pimeloyl-ACP methyl ester carboxylesterase